MNARTSAWLSFTGLALVVSCGPTVATSPSTIAAAPEESRPVEEEPVEASTAVDPAALRAPTHDRRAPRAAEPEQEPEGDGLDAPADVAAAPADARTTASGLATKVLVEGTGSVHPRATSRVLVHYTGWTTDGEMFDSSVARGQPIELPLNGVIRGWTEGLQLMVEGERRRLWIPERLAYGGRPGAPAGMLVFDVELIRIVAR